MNSPARRIELGPEDARRILLHATALGESFPRGQAGARAVLARLGCIQLDPIDRIGTNAELVAAARVDGTRRWMLHHANAGRAFEHFAKERCLLHASFFPHYRGQAVETPWWRHDERMRRLSASILDEVLAEVRERGPLLASSLADRGRVEPLSWDGWSSTARASSLALEVLWTRCEIVVAGRDATGRKLYDLPGRALGHWAEAPAEGSFGEQLLLARVRVAGLLARAGGACWSMLKQARSDGTVDRLLEAGQLVEVQLGRRPYLSLPAYLDAPMPPARPPRVLGPLDPLLWDRRLVEEAFGFAYTWEVYKPAERREFGWYVVPVLAGGRLVGRVEAVREEGALRVLGSWDVPARPLRTALAHLAAFNDALHSK